MRMPTKQPSGLSQEDLLSRYCLEAEQLLAEATDYESALRLRDEVCSRFEQECQSSLIATGTREYLTQIISRRWQQSHEQDH